MFEMIRNYLKITVKVLLRRKFYTFISLFGIAFTLVVLITAVALYENSYHPHRPESRSDRFLTLSRARYTSTKEPGREWSSNTGYKFLDRFARNLPGAEAMTIHSGASRVVAFTNGKKLEIMIKYTDGTFWNVMDFQFVEGGPYREEDNANKRMVAVINEATRDQYFGRTTVVGESITVDGRSFKVIGVVRNVPEYRNFPYSDVWIPINAQKSDLFRDMVLGDYFGTILAKSKADIPGIKAAIQGKLSDVPLSRPEDYDTYETYADTHLEAWAREWGPYSHYWREDAGVTRLLWMVAGLVLLFMLLPAINLININISRIMERAPEIGVRKAFGATSATLTIQFLIENLILTLLGGLLGLIGTWVVLVLINQSGYIPYADLKLNFNVFLAALGLSIVFGMFSGVYPAWRMSKTHPAMALKGGAR